jgi:pSer/pThr/pTyr-binding forkhead associated (FHA) protein
MEHTRAAARRALDDQLIVVEPGASSAANDDEESLITDARVIELMPGMAVDHGIEVLHVAFRNQISSLVGSGRKLMIGRANQADIHIPDQSVSRQHGRIGFENGEAYFTDLSTNGSRVIGSTGETILAKKQTVALGASGQMILGTNAGVPIHPPIRYVVSRTRGSRGKPVQANSLVDVGEDFEGLTATRII